MKEIPLRGYKAKDRVALVDDADYELVSNRLWYPLPAGNTIYALTQCVGPRKRTMLHNLIMNPPPGMLVDHRHGNGLDCRRSELRLCSYQQNAQNRRKYFARPGASKYKGVVLIPGPWRLKPWAARIGYNYRNRFLGTFFTEEEAALAYDKAAREIYGEFAVLNFGTAAPAPAGTVTANREEFLPGLDI